MAKLSVGIMTKNEEENIRACLESVKWADEILIIDNFSQDRTPEIARQYTDKIYQREFVGFGEQRQFSFSKASGEWFLLLDADEVLSEALQNDIRSVVSGAQAPYDGYTIFRKTFYLGKEIKHCGWAIPPLRLFKTRKVKSDLKKVHEDITVTGKIGHIESPMFHYSYKSLSQHIKKLDFYTTLQAEDFYKDGRRVTPANSLMCLAIKPLVAFLRKYILMKGFLDGVEGLLISIFTALAVFFNYAKAWEFQNQGRKKDDNG